VIEEFLDAQAVVNDTAVWAALQRRGVTDPATVYIEPWPAANFGEDFDASGRRLGRCVFYLREREGDQPWARPVQGLVAVADRTTGEVVHLIDDGNAVPVPRDPGRFDPEAGAPLRTDLRPLHITQPDGPSFSLEGGLLHWQRWSMRLGMHPIEGLVVRQLTYTDPVAGRERSILYRGAMAEMVVPYGDPQPQHFWRHVFDEGEVGMGRSANSLTLGCDCLGEIRYLDAPMVLSDGSVATIHNAVCIHEEDVNVLWRHHDRFANHTEVRRSRRLVVSFWATLGNYDYGYYWHFYEDGSLEVEVKLSGIPLASATTPDAPASPYGVRVRSDIELPHHQHFFCFRLDLDVDGPANTVEEVDLVVDEAGPANRYGNAFHTRATPIAEEASSGRRAEPLAGRVWRVANPSVRNALGEPVAYTLAPHVTSPLLLADPGSAVAKRAAWARDHLSVTRYAPGELRASGAYPNQHPGGAGVPAYRAAGRSLVDTDVVLWVTCGSNHISRTEDWPVMPVERTGFTLRPTGFFDRNPSLDVAPPERAGEGANGEHCH
jgi:primary-amine oxidase